MPRLAGSQEERGRSWRRGGVHSAAVRSVGVSMVGRSRRHPGTRSGHRARRHLLALPLLAALAGIQAPAGHAPVITARAAACTLPVVLCPPSPPSPTPPPRSATALPPAAAPVTPRTPAPPSATPSPPTPSSSAATGASAPHAAAPPPAPAGSPPVLPPRTGVPPPRGSPARAPATVAPARLRATLWEAVAATIVLLALGMLLALGVLRMRRRSQRAALYARYNRMRVERGLEPLPADQIELPRRRRP
jgi:hypothetical protein